MTALAILLERERMRRCVASGLDSDLRRFIAVLWKRVREGRDRHGAPDLGQGSR